MRKQVALKENRRKVVLVCLVLFMLGQCFTVYLLFGASPCLSPLPVRVHLCAQARVNLCPERYAPTIARMHTHTHTHLHSCLLVNIHAHTCMHALITGQEVFRNLVLLPPPSPRHAQTSITRHKTQTPMQTPITAAPDTSPQGKTWPSPPSSSLAETGLGAANPDSPASAPQADASAPQADWSPPPRPPPDFIELIWLVTLGDLLARHLGMVVKAVTLLLAPGIGLSYRQLTQVCVCALG